MKVAKKTITLERMTSKKGNEVYLIHKLSTKPPEARKKLAKQFQVGRKLSVHTVRDLCGLWSWNLKFIGDISLPESKLYW